MMPMIAKQGEVEIQQRSGALFFRTCCRFENMNAVKIMGSAEIRRFLSMTTQESNGVVADVMERVRKAAFL